MEGRRAEGDPVFSVLTIWGNENWMGRNGTSVGSSGSTEWKSRSAGDLGCPGTQTSSAGYVNCASPLCSRPRRKAAGIHRGAEDVVERATLGTAEAGAPNSTPNSAPVQEHPAHICQCLRAGSHPHLETKTFHDSDVVCVSALVPLG